MAGGAATVEAGTERSQDFDHVPDQVVLSLRAFHHHELAPLRAKRGLDLLRAEAQEPVAMLDHDLRDFRVGQKFYQLGAMSIPAGTNLGHGLHDGQAMMVSVHQQAA